MSDFMPEVCFQGPAGRIEGRFTQVTDKKAPVALVLHPHPLYGGTMNNKVVYSAYKTFVDNGFTTLRINFRGVGRSQGSFDNGVGELTDAATALDWLQIQNPLASAHFVAGFSFGSWIGMQLIMRRPEISNFIAIAPPVNKYDFSFLSPCPIPGMIIHGDKDSIAPEDAVLDLVDKLSKQKHSKIESKTIYGADHFFRDKLDELEESLGGYIRSRNSASSVDCEDATKVRSAPQKLLLD